jgi:hypothetical protein
MKSEHNLLASQALFFQYLSVRLKDEAADSDGKKALRTPGYLQWIDAMECLFHDSTADLNWVCSVDATFLTRGFVDVYNSTAHSSSMPHIQSFAPTVVCVVPNHTLQLIFSRHHRGQNQSRIRQHAAFFRHFIRVGVISECQLKKAELWERVINLRPFLEFFKLQSASDRRIAATFRDMYENLIKSIFSLSSSDNVKTFAILPAISAPNVFPRTRQFKYVQKLNSVMFEDCTGDMFQSSSQNAHCDFLDKLRQFKANHGSAQLTLIIFLKDPAGRMISPVFHWDHELLLVQKNKFSCQVLDSDRKFWRGFDVFDVYWSVCFYAVYSLDCLLDHRDIDISFDFAKCLSSASAFTSVPKERLQAVVKQGHSFSDQLSFTTASRLPSTCDSLFGPGNLCGHEGVVADVEHRVLPDFHSPWISRPAFPRPTLGSPFFLLFLFSKPGVKFGKNRDYLLESNSDDLTRYSAALQQLGSALYDVRKSAISHIDPRIIQRDSYLYFKWDEVCQSMPWRRQAPIPPRDVLYRMRACASNLL